MSGDLPSNAFRYVSVYMNYDLVNHIIDIDQATHIDQYNIVAYCTFVPLIMGHLKHDIHIKCILLTLHRSNVWNTSNMIA